MSGKRHPEEFKTEAVKQVVDRGYSVASVATRLDITTHSLYAWIKKYGPDPSINKEQSDAQAEIRRLQKELKRVTDERDILKKAAVDSICQCHHFKLREARYYSTSSAGIHNFLLTDNSLAGSSLPN